MTYEEQESYLATLPEPQPQRDVMVTIGGYEIMESEGECWQEFVCATIRLTIPDGGFFGWGERAAIDAQLAESHPGFIALETWPAPPITEEF